MLARLLSSLLFRLRLSRAGRRGWVRLAGVVGAVCLGAAGHAQTAQFSYAIQTLAGGFNDPGSVAVDGSGNVFVADGGNQLVKEIPFGCTSASCVNALGGAFRHPQGIAVDGSGNVYVADTYNDAVKKMAPTCTSSACVQTLGGGFSRPYGVAVDATGNVYVGDTKNNAVKKMASTCTSSSCVTTLGGGFNQPQGVAVDESGNIYIADDDNHAVKKMASTCTSSSCVTTLSAGFQYPYAVAADSSGNVYVVDLNSSAVEKLPSTCTSSSCVTTLGGGFNDPQGVAVDSSGNVYVADSDNSAVEEIETSAVAFPSTAIGQSSQSPALTFTFTAGGKVQLVRTVTEGATGLDFTDAGTGTCDTNGSSYNYNVGDTCTVVVNFAPKYPGLRQGAAQLVSASGSIIGSALVYGTGTGPQMVFNAPLSSASLGGGFHTPQGLAVDGSGNVYVADTVNNAVKEVPSGCANSICVSSLGGGFSFPGAVAHDGAYNVYVADAGNSAVKEIPSGCTSSSCVLTLGGGFNTPEGVAVDGSGNVYVADALNNAVKEIPAGCSSSSCVATLGGGFNSPDGVAVDSSGNVYVADTGNSAVKEIPFGCTSSSCVTTLGGGFNSPRQVTLDAAGDVYVSDTGNDALKEIPSGCTSSSCVLTLATGASSVDGVAIDGGGNVYYSDNSGNTINKLTRTTAPTLTFATPTAIGSTDTTDGTQTATVANIGNQALSFPVPASGSTNPSFPRGFVYDSGSTCSQLTSSSGSAATLAAGASCSVGIDFQPAHVNTSSGSVVLTDTSLNGAYASQSIVVSGTGVKQTPTITVSPAVSYYGTTSVTLSATVAYVGPTVPTGEFTFQVGSGTAFAATCTGLGSPLTCTASYSTGSLAAGSYTITGSLAADGNDNSASNTGTLTVTANANNPETESVLWNFGSSSGFDSDAGLIQASDGNFYGATYYGGNCSAIPGVGCGTIFQITPAGSYTVIHTFTGRDGCSPVASLVQGTDGNLYGSTLGFPSGSCASAGTVFKISIASPYTFTLMHTFSGSDGYAPEAALVQGNDGNFYGMTLSGGANSNGEVFKISPSSPYTLTVLHSFAGGTTDGKNPYGALVQGNDGNFYGTTGAGGVNNAGTAFKISPVSPYTFTLMHSFSGASDGGLPLAGLVQGTDGNLYGSTSSGGVNSAGIAFKISPTSPYTETVLHAFSNVSTDGDQPYYGALLEGSDGNFYGTTKAAGANGVGLAYSISSSSPYTLSLLHSFASATTDGNTPEGGLVQGADGNFYGTTTVGGTNNDGVIYKLTPGSALGAPVSLSAPASVSAGAGFTLSYAVLNAPPAGTAVGTMQQCFATNTAGDTTVWTGVKTGYATATNASLTAPTTPDTYSYTLTCGGMESSSVTVTVPDAATFGTVSFSPAATELQGTSVAVTISDTVTYNGVQPTGAVTFTLNGVGYTATCTSTGSPSGSPETCSATVPAATIAALTRNSYTVTAALAADGVYAAATGASGRFTVTYPTSYSAPTEPVGTASAAQTVTVPFTTTFTVGSVSVLTLGATGLDYNPASGGTCANGFSATPSTTCTVKYTFTPKFAGARNGAIVVKDTSGNTQATVYLNGTGTGPQAVFNAPLTTAALGGGFSGPEGVAVDGSGNVYVADRNNNAVKEIPSGCSSSSCVLTLGGGFSSPYGVAVDGAGNVYVGDLVNNAVKEIPSGCTSSSCVLTLGGGFGQPNGVAVDGSGNVYVADTANEAIKEIPVGCTSSSCVSTLASLGLSTGYVAVDGSGNVYFSYNKPFTRQIYEIPSSCMSSGCLTALGGGFSTPQGIAVDGSGNIYVADSINNALKVMPSGCTSSSCVTTLATGFNTPEGVALDGGGNVYVGDAGNKLLKKFDRVDAPTLTFATATPVGSTDTTDGAQSATLANIGNQALSFSVPATGTNPSLSASFVRDSGSTCTQVATGAGSAGTLAAGASCTLGVDFVPEAIGNPLMGTAVFTDNSLNVTGSMQTVTLSGVSTGDAASSANSTVVASPSPAVAGSTVTVTATLQDAGGNAINGATASFSSTSTTASFGTPSVSGNVITVSMTDAAVETAPISVTLGGAATGTLTGSAQFVAPVYVVTVATDPTSANESASHCVDPNVSTSGNSNCSLREAVGAANALAGVATNINFATPLFASPQTILIAQSTPITINASMNINGPGANLLTVEGGTAPLSRNNYQVFLQKSGTVTLSGLTVANGLSSTYGGGIKEDAGTLTVLNSTFSDNVTQSGSGGGGAIYANSTLTVSNSTFSGNKVAIGSAYGGAIYANSTLTVNNSTFSDNLAAGGSEGGAIGVFSTLTVSNSTFSGNQAGTGGAIFAQSTLTVSNSIFSGDSASSGSGIASVHGGSLTDIVYNGDSFSGVTPANSINADPKLSALGFYGGSTQTFLPLPGSAAICAGTQPTLNGTPLTTDQRGVAISATRYGQTACYDIGAVQTEYAMSGPLTVPSLLTPGTTVSPAATVSLTENGAPLTAGTATVTLSDTDNDLSSGTSASNSLTTGVVTFGSVQFSTAEASDTLTATLSLNPATPVSLTVTSNSFQVGQLTPVLAFAPSPSSQTYGTAIAAGSLDATASYGGSTVAGTFAYAATSNTTGQTTALTAGSTILPADTYTLTATFTPTNTTLYKSGLTVQAGYTVGKASQTISFTTAPPASATYGTQFTVLATGGGSGVALVYASGGGCSNVGATYTMTSGTTACIVTISQAGNTNYLAAANSVTTVSANLATPTVSLMVSPSAVLSQNPVTLTAAVASPVSTPTRNVTFFDGTVVLGTVPLNAGVASLTTSSLSLGTHPITVVYSGDSNFMMLTTAATGVVVSDFNLSFPGTGSQTVLPGGTATYGFTLSPLGSATLPSAVTLGVSGLPAGATYVFNPGAMVAAGAGPTTLTLTITVPQQKAMLQRPSKLLPVSMAALLLLPFAGTLRRRAGTLSRLCAMVLLLAGGAVGLSTLTGCGAENGFFAQPQQSYQVTVNATSGALSHTTTFTLTVQ